MLLLRANGCFVATEFALVSVRRSRIQQHALEGDPRASGILNRLDHLDISIAATQVGITACTLGLGLLGIPAIARVLQPVVGALPVELSDGATSDAGDIFTVEELDGLRVAQVRVHPALPPESVAA